MTSQDVLPYLLIGGDLSPVGKMGELLRSAPEFLDPLLRAELAGASLVAVNLEAPTTHTEGKAPKSGPWLRADPDVLSCIRQHGIDTLFLANNHIMDFGAQGLEDTMRACEQLGLRTLGAGRNLEQARAVLVHVVNDVRIAIINVAEEEFGTARSDRPGYHGLDVIECARLIKQARTFCDVVIVSLHGGLEYFALPRPGLRQTCRFFVEEGAAAVVCHHTHVSSAYEVHEGHPIFYGIGNLVFDNDCGRSDWELGFFVRLRIDPAARALSSFELLPFRQSTAIGGIRLLTGPTLQAFHRSLSELNDVLLDPNRYEAAWAACCAEKELEYLVIMYFPFLHWPVSVLKRLPFAREIVFPLRRALVRLNLIRCDSHLEVIRHVHASAAEKGRL